MDAAVPVDTTASRKKTRSKHTSSTLDWDLFAREVGTAKDTPVALNSDTDSCAACGGYLAIGPDGFPTCLESKCGLVYTNVIDRSPEWRHYGGAGCGGDPTRCGMPINPLLRESSFGCKVMTNARSTWEMRKLKRYTDWIGMPYKEKSHYDEFQRITNLANQSGIPKLITDDAMRFHKRISEKKTFRGLNRDGIIAASVYLSARRNGFPRTPREIARIFLLDHAAATRGCKNAMTIMNELEHPLAANERTNLCLSKPESFVPRYCSRLGMSDNITKVCIFAAMRVHTLDLVPENTPHAIAAGIVFFIAHHCQVPMSKRDVSTVSEISEVTINKCFRKLNEHQRSLIPPQIAAQYA